MYIYKKIKERMISRIKRMEERKRSINNVKKNFEALKKRERKHRKEKISEQSEPVEHYFSQR